MSNTPSATLRGTLRIVNIGELFTGEWGAPVRRDVDVIICRDGVIESVGSDTPEDMPTLDAAGSSVLPGLIDPHVHPVFGDFTPRHSTLGWIEAHVNGGVTTMISAGEPHVPGRPSDAAGVKALAILAHKAFQKVHPLGATVHAGAVLLEKGLVESDFAELAAEGCWLVGEIGISGVYQVDDALPMVQAAKKHGFRVSVHVGGASVPGSSVIGADTVVALRPHVAVHCNGGPTAPSNSDIERIVDETDAGIEVVQAGNIRALIDVVRTLRDRDALGRLQIASDTPSGTGVIPSAILRTMAYCVSLAGVTPEEAVCAATGQTARRFGLPCGVIAPGRPADITVLAAPRGSTATTTSDALAVGDMPAVAAVVIAGTVRLTGSRVTPPPMAAVSVRSS
jgi:enamidase